MTKNFLPFAQALHDAMPDEFTLSVFSVLAIGFSVFAFFLALFFLVLFLLQKKKGRVLRDELTRILQKYQQLQLENSRLTTRLESEEQLFTEKITLLQEARDELKLQFQHLAGEIFDEKSIKFSQQNSEKLGAILTPFHQELGELRKEISEIYNKDSRERFALKEQLMQLQDASRHLGEEANSLALALKGDNKIQGNWGELVLERLLEVSGLRKGVEFTTQDGYRNEGNQLLKPDVVIHLPDKRNVIIDAKTSLLSWNNYLNSENKDEQQRALKELLTSFRNHFTGLGSKDYPAVKGLHSLDFVLMFIPVEAAFAAACRHDPALMEEALGHNVILTSPTSLLPTLRTIENLWKFEQQEKNAREIAHRAALLYDKFRSFVEEMEKLGKQLESARSSYDSALNKLSQGRGNLIAQTMKLQELGVQPKKELPSSIVEKAEL